MRLSSIRRSAFSTPPKSRRALLAATPTFFVEPLENRRLLSAAPATLATLPLAAQQTISADIGQDQTVYHAAATGDGVSLANPANGFSAAVQAGTLLVSAGSDTWDLSLLGLSYGGAVQPVGTAQTSFSANRVDSNYTAVDEWYINGPGGLEQGFTVAPLAAAQASGSLTVALSLGGDLSATVNTAGNGLTLSRANGSAALSYTGLAAYDATGKALPATLQVQTDGGQQELLIQVNDAGAQGKITIDPFVEQAQLTVSDGASGDIFGSAVAISGNTVVVGAPDATINSSGDAGPGAAYIFTESGPIWGDMTETAKLTASNGVGNDSFGSAVAISGNTVVVGAWNANSAQGAAYVFVEPGTGWTDATETAELTASTGAAGDEFGWSVAISGNTALVGAPLATVTGNSQQGAAYEFTAPGTGWVSATETAELTSSDGAAGDYFGSAVAISGNTALVGAPNATILGSSSQGAAYVFAEPGTGWVTTTETAKLTSLAGAAGDSFGSAVALDGNTALVGAPYATVGGNAGQGTVYVFSAPVTGWATTTETADLTSSDGAAGDYFGTSVAISGNTAVVGAPQATVNGNAAQGAAYVFSEPATGWATATETTKLDDPGATAGDIFGQAVAISGNAAVVGAPDTTIGINANQGAAYVASTATAPTIVGGLNLTGTLVANNGLPNDNFGYAVAIDGNTAVVGATQYNLNDILNSGNGTAYVFTLAGGTWTQAAQLTAPDGSPNDYFGDSVAISGNTVLVGAMYATVNNNSREGEAYVFAEPTGGWQNQVAGVDTATLSIGNAAGGAPNDYFGSSVAFSGNTAVIGALGVGNATESQQGAAYVFNLTGNSTGNITGITSGIPTGNITTGNSTALIAELTAADGNTAGNWFGSALSLNGNTIVVGAEHAKINGNTWQGAAYVFTKPGTGWVGNLTQNAKLTASDGNASDDFGDAVAISGNTVVVGAEHATIGGTSLVAGNLSQGAAYVFTAPATGWAGNLTQTNKLIASDGATGDEFGDAVAIDGDTIVVGAFQADTTEGAAYVFLDQPGSAWGNITQTNEFPGNFSTGSVAGDQFGSAVAISDTTILVGADQATATYFGPGNVSAGDGAAYVFNNSTFTVTAPDNQTANATSSQSFIFGNFTQTDGVAPYTVEVNWGDGTNDTVIGNLATAGVIPAGNHTYANPGNYTVTVTVTDAGNNTSNNSLTFGVDVATITTPVLGNQSAMLNQSQTFNFGNFTQVNATGNYSADINWGDGTIDTIITGLTTGGVLNPGSGAIGNASHTYAAVGNDTVTLTVSDADGHASVQSTTFSVDVASITITTAANQGANAGVIQSFSLGSFRQVHATGPYTYTVNWGDGSGNTTGTANPGALLTASHAYVISGNDTVTITVTDADNHTSSSTFTVDVAAITLTAPANQFAAPGLSQLLNLGSFQAYNVSGNFTVDVTWGDGNTSAIGNLSATGVIPATAHTYASYGVDTASVQVIGAGGQKSNVVTFTVLVGQATSSFSNLTLAPGIGLGTATVTFGGTITAINSHVVVIPPSSEFVAVTLNGVTQEAAISATGNFSTTFNTSTLPAATTPYQVTYTYAGDTSFTAVTDNTTTALTVNGEGIPVYRLFSPVTKEHLYTSDLNEYNVLGTLDWVQEGIAFYWCNGPATLGGVSTEPVYRLYDPNDQQHLWTTDANEYNTLKGYPGIWNAEGIAGYVFTQQVASSTPLYRLVYPFQPDLHLWTTNQVEETAVVQTYGWQLEGIIGYALFSSVL